MARASISTLLPLDTFAKIMGIDPVHFNQGQSTNLFPVKANRCEDIWSQYSWQAYDRVGREDLARAIYDAEQEIARVVGYWPAPKWVSQEVHRMPRHHRRDLWRQAATNARGARVSIRTKYGKFIQGGRRNVDTLVGTVTSPGGGLTYDLAAMTATISLATTLTDECELKAYFNGHSAAPEWEIRPARSKSISGGTLTMVLDAWSCLDPDLWEAYPTGADFGAIDISDSGNYVDTIDVYREYNDWTQAACTFYWEPRPQTLTTSFCTCGGSGCSACTLTTQDGCLHVRDTENGIVVPAPSTYDSDDETWDQDAFTECRDPDEVKLWYYSGQIDDAWLAGSSCEALSNFWAHPIAWLATARLERPFCHCGPVTAMAEHLREDMAMLGETSYQLDPADLRNPFGTRRGEIMAWRRISGVAVKRMSGGAA